MKISLFIATLAISAASMTVSVAAMAADAPAKLAGGVLVAANGMTLYTFDADKASSGKSACNGPCAGLWPPLTALASDQPGSPYSVVTRDDGSRQFAYKGKPLYFYKADQKAGDQLGDNFKDVWHVVKE
jgi:predicted lipoprotein with Yx(FWY)xxD motif